MSVFTLTKVSLKPTKENERLESFDAISKREHLNHFLHITLVHAQYVTLGLMRKKSFFSHQRDDRICNHLKQHFLAF